MENYIYEIDEFLSNEECNNIIQHFEEEPTLPNFKINENILTLNINDNDDKNYSSSKNSLFWYDICNKIKIILNEKLKDYINKINVYDENNNMIYNCFSVEDLKYRNIVLIKNFNHFENFKYVNEFYKDGYETILTLYIFLNDSTGNLVFLDYNEIIPKTGKLLIFPSSFTFPYKELNVINENKYYLLIHIRI